MPPGVEPGIAAHTGVDEWLFPPLDSLQSAFPGAFDASSQDMQQDARASSGVPDGNALAAAGFGVDDGILAAAGLPRTTACPSRRRSMSIARARWVCARTLPSAASSVGRR
eukprot:5312754-Prymnesium_polylepis.1